MDLIGVLPSEPSDLSDLSDQSDSSDSSPPKKLVDLLTRWLVDFAKLAQLCFLFLPMSQGA